MKLFGEYLIEKGLIDAESLVDALIEQVRSLPTTVEIVRAQKLMSAANIVKAFKIESETGGSFVAAAKALGAWTPEVETVVNREVKLRRMPLGQILVRRGILSVEKMAAALDDFLGDLPVDARKSGRGPATAPVVHLTSVQKETPLTEAVRGEFTESRLSRFAAFFDGMVTSQPVASDLRATADELHLLRGTSRLVGAPRLERLVVLLEDSANFLAKHPKPDTERMARLAIAAGDAVRVVRSIAEILSRGMAESAYFGEKGNVAAFDGAYAALQRVRDELSMAV